MQSADATLRAASYADLGAMSRLLVQLYDAELPGMLRGDLAARTEVARRLLASAPLGRRYVLLRAGEVAGMGSLATLDEPRPSVPAGVLLAFPRIMGPLEGARSLGSVLRGLLTAAGPPGPDEAQVHSVVVDEAARGGGHGAAIMGHLEREVAALGKRRVVLQVLASNAAALRFYRSLGYREDGAAHGSVRSALAFPSLLMRKDV